MGDLKAIEYSTQLFMDMGYNAPFFEEPSNVKKHMSQFYSSLFGENYGNSIADLKWKYFDFGFRKKTRIYGLEPNRNRPQNQTNGSTIRSFGDENQKRIDQYQSLENQADAIKSKLPKDLQDAYFQLVYYPTKAASLINKKFLYADKATIYGKQGRLNAKDCLEIGKFVQ